MKTKTENDIHRRLDKLIPINEQGNPQIEVIIQKIAKSIKKNENIKRVRAKLTREQEQYLEEEAEERYYEKKYGVKNE